MYHVVSYGLCGRAIEDRAEIAGTRRSMSGEPRLLASNGAKKPKRYSRGAADEDDDSDGGNIVLEVASARARSRHKCAGGVAIPPPAARPHNSTRGVLEVADAALAAAADAARLAR